MAGATSNFWATSGVSAVEFHTNLVLISALVGKGANLKGYIAPKRAARDQPLSGHEHEADQPEQLVTQSKSSELFRNDEGDCTDSHGDRSGDDELGCDDSEADADDASIDSLEVRTDPSRAGLLESFLDRIAELASAHHGGRHVVSSIIEGLTPKRPGGEEVQRGPEPVRLYLAKNEPFQEMEKMFLCKVLPRLIAGVAEGHHKRTDDVLEIQNSLWASMIGFAKDRFFGCPRNRCRGRQNRNHGVARGWLRDFVDAYEDLRNESRKALGEQAVSAPILIELQDIYKSCTERLSGGSDLDEIAKMAYSLRRSTIIETSWKQTACQPLTRRLLTALMFLGRVRSTFELLLRACSEFPEMQKLDIKCIYRPSPDPSRPRLQSVGSLLEYLPPGSSAQRRALGLYAEYTGINLQVHCEVQLAFNVTIQNSYPYIGGSKRPCFLCHCFLTEAGFHLKPSHGSFFPQWTFPSIQFLDAADHMRSESENLQVAARKIRELLRMLVQTLKASTASTTFPQSRQSTAGVTSSELKLDYRDSERSRIADWKKFEKKKQAEKLTEESELFSGEIDTGNSYPEPCDFCGVMTTRACGICNRGWVCMRTHERQYHVGHPAACLPRTMLGNDFAPRSCSICSRAFAFLCRTCRSSAYCSFECYSKDRVLHLKLCSTFAQVRFARPQPPPKHRLMIWIPEEDEPQIIWVPLTSQYGLDDIPLIEDLMGYPGRPNFVFHDKVQGRPIDRTVNIFGRDASLLDGSTLNRSISALVGATAHAWNGPFLVARQPLPSQGSLDSYNDVFLEDFTTAVNWFKAYATTLTTDPQVAGPARTQEKVVQVNCEHCQDTYGWPTFEERLLHADSDFGAQNLSLYSSIAGMLGFSLRTFPAIDVPKEITEDYGSQSDLDEDQSPRSNGNDNSEIERPVRRRRSTDAYHYIQPLHLDVDLQSDTWGLHPQIDELQEFKTEFSSCNYIVQKTDGGLTSSRDVANICRFCADVKTVFGRARLGQETGYPLTREDAMAAITWENFANASEKYETGPDTWSAQGLAPWEV